MTIKNGVVKAAKQKLRKVLQGWTKTDSGKSPVKAAPRYRPTQKDYERAEKIIDRRIMKHLLVPRFKKYWKVKQ